MASNIFQALLAEADSSECTKRGYQLTTANAEINQLTADLAASQAREEARLDASKAREAKLAESLDTMKANEIELAQELNTVTTRDTKR